MHSVEFSSASSGLEVTVGSLVQSTATCSTTDISLTVYEIFETQPRLEGVVVLDNEAPVGLIMRNAFYQKIGSLYGYSLHMKRPVIWLMDTNMLIASETTDIASISSLAMKRDSKNLYDLIVVTRYRQYVGVVSIRLFLIELSQSRERQIEMLQLANERERSFSQTIASNNAELERRNQAIKNLLNHAGQGFLSFSRDFIIDHEYSAECTRIFDRELHDLSYLELIGSYLDEETVECITKAFSMLFAGSNTASAEVLFSLLPQEFMLGRKTVSVEYKLIEPDRVMLILTDISDRVELSRKVREDERNLQLILKSITCYEDVRNGLDELRSYLTTDIHSALACADDALVESLTGIFRVVHTFKGEFAQYGLHCSARGLHELEERISQLIKRSPCTPDDIYALRREIDYEEIVRQDVQVITQTLGEDYFNRREACVIQKEQVRHLRDAVISVCQPAQVAQLVPPIMELLCHNLKDILSDYGGYVEYLSARLEKPVIPLLVTGDDVFIHKASYSGVLKSLVHIFRNALDHGIESLDERFEVGKCEYATIACDVRQTTNNELTIAITDDGRGIDLKRIRAEAGLAEHETIADEELIRHIFRDQFTTKSSVDMLSGRGVGLAAVRYEVERTGGTVKATTQPGQGTTFVITLPVISTFDLDYSGG